MKNKEKIKLEQLFKEMKQGNNQIIEELYNRYNKVVYGIAFSILKNKEDSEDVVQIVFSKLYSIDKSKLPKEKSGTWLYSVTKNEALAILRKKYDNIGLENIYNCESENNEIDNFIDKESYNKLINKLSEKEQEIVSLKILSNLTFEEIAIVLGESINTIKWRYYKSIYSLRIMLGNLSMFIITAILGIESIKNRKKSSEIIETEGKVNEDTDNFKEEEKKEYTIQKAEEKDSFENIIIKEETSLYNTNYLSIGIFNISAIFLILTIIFLIFLAKHQLNARKKSSKQ